MTILDLCKMGATQVVNLAKSGRLTPGHLWTAMNGAATYLTAVAAGDVASPKDADSRVVVCYLCRSATYESKAEANAKAMYCGESFQDNRDDPELKNRTCGCLVGVTVNGRPYAGGKTCVASEECPQGNWKRVPPC